MTPYELLSVKRPLGLNATPCSISHTWGLLGIAGLDGYFKQLNPAWALRLGRTEEKLLMRPFVDFVHPDDLAATLAELAKPAAGADSIAFENRYAHQDAHVETHFYRIAQEAVRNAVSHGRASKIAVTLQVAKNQCTLAIRDDGAEISKDSVHCSGMRTMQYRARLIGASLWVWPDPELGTWVKRVFAPPSLLTKIISDA